MNATTCTYCAKDYLKPCNGTNEACENRKHVDKQKAAHEAQTISTENEDQPVKETQTS